MDDLKAKFRTALLDYYKNEEILRTKFLLESTNDPDKFWLRDHVFNRPLTRAYGLYARRVPSLYTARVLHRKHHDWGELGDQYDLFLKDYVMLTYRLKKLFIEHGEDSDIMVSMRWLYIHGWDGQYLIETDPELNRIYGMYTHEVIPIGRSFFEFI